MTLPVERYQSLKKGKKLLEDLCDPGRTPRVPRKVREKALATLKHYPLDCEIDDMIELLSKAS